MQSQDREGWDHAWAQITVQQELATLSYAWVRPALDFISRHLEPHSRVLEAGCGPGRYLYWLTQQGHAAVGLDCSQEALGLSLEHTPEAERVLADVSRLPFRDGAFDACLSFGVIEHFPEGPDRALAEVRRVLRPGGKLVLSVPHINLLARIDPPLKALYRRCRHIALSAADENEPPGRYYGRQELRAALERNAFEVLEVMPFGHAYTWHSFCHWFRKRGAHHDVTPLGRALGRLSALVAPWAMASTAFIAGRTHAPGH